MQIFTIRIYYLTKNNPKTIKNYIQKIKQNIINTPNIDHINMIRHIDYKYNPKIRKQSQWQSQLQ